MMQMKRVGDSGMDQVVQNVAQITERVLEYSQKYATPLTPAVYAVWFTYFQRSHEAVNEFIDRSMNMGDPLTEAALTEFYHQNLSPRAMSDELRVMTSTLGSAMGEVAGVMDNTLKDHTAFSGALKNAKQSLVHGTSKREVAAIITQMHKVNQQHIASAHRMSTQLEKNRSQVSKLEKELAEVRRTTNTDYLTKLANRRRLDDLLDQALFTAKQKNQPVSLILCDIDRLGRVNDKFGFSAGDNVLKTYAKQLSKHLVGDQVAARFAGAKFALLLPNTSGKEAGEIAEAISVGFKKLDWVSSETGEEIGMLTSSFGVTELSPNENKQQLIDRADRLLSDAKRQGPDCIVAT